MNYSLRFFRYESGVWVVHLNKDKNSQQILSFFLLMKKVEKFSGGLLLFIEHLHDFLMNSV
jgi:hypothetical protein